jgi:type II secretory pathway component PulF
MEALILMLFIPTLGGCLLLAEAVRCRGTSERLRRWGWRAVAALGIVAGVTSALLLVWVLAAALTVTRIQWLAGALVQVVALGGVAVLVGYGCLAALRVCRTEERTETIRAQAEASRRGADLQLAAWCMVLSPLLLFGLFGIFAGVPLLMVAVYWVAARRARQGQFLWVLAMSVEHSLPLAEEVEGFALSRWRHTARPYLELAARLREGRPLNVALSLSGVLPRPLVQELSAAESSGRLATTLREMAVRFTARLQHSRFDNSLAVAGVYLWSTLAVLVTLTAFLSYWIVPKLLSIFEDFDAELPLLTKWMVVAVSSQSRNVPALLALLGVPVVLGMLVLIVGVWGWGDLNVPLLMRWFPRWDAPAVLRSLAHGVRGSRPLPEAIQELGELHHRADVRERIARMSLTVSAGGTLASALAAEGYVRPAEQDALEWSARAGHLAWALAALADCQERASNYRVRIWMELVKPLFVLAVGVLVALFVVSLFLPLVSLVYAVMP